MWLFTGFESANDWLYISLAGYDGKDDKFPAKLHIVAKIDSD